MNEKTVISVCLYDAEIYFLTIDSIYAKWSSSLYDNQFFSNSEEAKKTLELNFNSVCNSLGNNAKFINKIKISNIELLDSNNYEILSEEYFIGGNNEDE